jgi:hypothetical protein
MKVFVLLELKYSGCFEVTQVFRTFEQAKVERDKRLSKTAAALDYFIQQSELVDSVDQ